MPKSPARVKSRMPWVPETRHNLVDAMLRGMEPK